MRPETGDADGADKPALSAADAATVASLHAARAAESAADTATAAEQASKATNDVAAHAREATAEAVDLAAAATAELAALAAAAMEAEAIKRALELAAAAATARAAIRSQANLDGHPADARSASADVAATVALDVVAQARAAADAARLVADAVARAANLAASAAQGAAVSVEQAAAKAASTADEVVESSATTRTAAELVVASLSRVADLAPELRTIAAIRRARLLRDTPLVAELEAGLTEGEFRLLYQPMYSMQTGNLVAVEALLRWQHPTRGLLAPASFLHVVEEHPELLIPVGEWVMNTAIDQAEAWLTRMDGWSPRMWVNVACDQLGDGRLPDLMGRRLSVSELPPGSIGVEVTERQLISRGAAVAADLMALRGLGVALAVDDFGTGYASLDYLRRFPFDEIKIDRSFVAGLGTNKADTEVTSAIVALGAALDLTTVAEGVETQAQYDLLRELGCSVAQGYLLQRPAPEQTITELLELETRAVSARD